MSASVFGSVRAIAGRCAAMLIGEPSFMPEPAIKRMTGQERANQRTDLVASIFQHIVPGVRKRVDFRVRKAPPPLREEIAVEDEIAFAPADHHGDGAKA